LAPTCHVFPEASAREALAYDARAASASLRAPWQRRAAFAFELLSTVRDIRCRPAGGAWRGAAEATTAPAPACLTNAFAHSDPERQAGVQRMLQEAADRGLQVILLNL